MAQDLDKKQSASAPGPELRLLDRRAFVGFPPLEVMPGLRISDFALQVPDVSFPFNLNGGALRYQRKKLQFGFLELELSSELVARRVSEVANRLLELEDLKLHFRAGYLEGQARTKTSERAPLTFKVAFDGDGESLAVYLYDVRFYGFSSTPAAQIPVLLSRAVEELDLLPQVSLRGASGFSSKVLGPLCQVAAVSRGFKLPHLDGARLSAVEVSAQGLKLRFASGGLPPPATPDEELLLALEGSRAFADAEGLIALGKLAEAREAYLKLGDIADAHPYAAERLLGLLVADPQAHELALDVAAALLRRREKSKVALWAEAVVRERRGEHARASERYLALCALARKSQEEAAAFFSAEAAARSARDHAPQMAARALHELLGLRPDHLPSLKALARASDQAQDRAGAIRAYRRISALSRDPSEAADAHVHLARLSAQTEDDIAGARLHCEAALKLSPDNPEALYLLGELCHRSGEHLRAVKALDRLRDVAMGRHELDRVGRANLLAGRVWDEGLHQLENALLRYREAVSLLPGEPEPLYFAARTAEQLGKLPEAISGYQQTVELAGPAPRTDEIRRAAHASHHALSGLYRKKLGDPARGREHLEAALALDPRDLVALEELIPYFRAAGRATELADACEKAAAVVDGLEKKAAFWAEAAELYRGRLNQPDKAEKWLNAALDADPRNRTALEGLLALAESRRDGEKLCRCLRALAELSAEGKDRVRYYRRLAVAARDLTFDHDLAAHALTQVLALEPDDLPTLGELCGLQRKRADMVGLSAALEQRARAAENAGDKRLAAAALRELANVLETRLGRSGEALVALEKAARLSPEAGVLLDLADLSMRCERPAHARRALEDMLAGLPRHASAERVSEIRSRLGKACDLLGDRDAAIEHYAAAFPSRKLDDELSTRLEALYDETGRTRELADLWAKRADALFEARRAQDAAPLLLKSARGLLQAGDAGAAKVRFEAVLEASPASGEAASALEALSELELARGNRLDASALLARRATLLDQGRPAARLLLAAAKLAEGTPREAKLLAQALEQDPAYVPALVRRAYLTEQSEPDLALQDLAAALAVPDTDSEAPTEQDKLGLVRLAASCALRSGELDQARRYFARYSEERPDDLDVVRELSTLHRKAGAKEALHELLGKSWPRLADEEKLEACREYAALSIELGRPEAAAEALRGLLKLDRKNLWAAKTLFGLLPIPGEVRPAADPEPLRLLTILVGATSDAERGSYLERRARLLLTEAREDEAISDLEQAAGLSPRAGALFLELAGLHRDRREPERELSAWERAVQADAQLQPRAAERALDLGAALFASGHRDPARAAYRFATTLPLSPDAKAQAFVGLAEVARSQGDLPAAAAAFLDASRQGEPARRVESLRARAELLEGLGELDEAAAALEQALLLAPGDAEASAALLQVVRANADWSRLAELLDAEAKRTAESDPAAAVALLDELGALYAEKLERPDAAERAYRAAVKLAPERVEGWSRLLALLCARARHEQAEEIALAAADGLTASDAAELLRGTALELARSGANAGALTLLRRAHRSVPADGKDRELLAELLFAEGAFAEALPLQEQLAAEVDFDESPEKAEGALLRLAAIALEEKDADTAERALRRLLQQRPGSAEATERLAALLEPTDPRQAISLLWGLAEKLPASEATSARLLELAERAANELADVDFAAVILRHAMVRSPEPVAARRRLVRLLRDAGRTGELMEALQALGRARLEAGAVDEALEAHAEWATLAEQSGRVDEALAALVSLREISEGAGKAERAAGFELRRAELLRDAKLELTAAEEALERSHSLHPLLETAQMGVALARRREDARGQARWLERAATLEPSLSARGAALLALGKLHQFQLASPEQAESAFREALRTDPALAEAEELLLALLEGEGRLAELAAHFEEAAALSASPDQRVALYRKAAALYRDRAEKPEAAISALLAARAAAPDDLSIATEAAELLAATGRTAEAAEFDALVLERDPLADGPFARHRAHLVEERADLELGQLLLARGDRLDGDAGAELLLEAAAAFRRAGATERALLCEDHAFAKAPGNDVAFAAQRARVEGEPRKLSELLARRAESVSRDEAVALLRERAQALLVAGEALLAADAFDELLALVGEDVPALTARAELAAEGGGAQAAQLYDRRLLAAKAEVPVPVRLRAQLRLGHAALAARAYHDAADAFEAVVALDPAGEKGKEALSLLSEVFSRTEDTSGLFRTQLELAKRSEGAEAEALLRRAAELFDSPAEGLDAWLPLAKLRPADARIVERAAEGLKAAGRAGDLVELYERSASATGGGRAAELLLAAAEVAEAELSDPEAAGKLRSRAAEAAPDDARALRVLAFEQRRRQDGKLRATLEKLVELTPDAEERAVLTLELAQLHLAGGETAPARARLEQVVARGVEGAGYRDALDRLEALLIEQGDHAALGPVFAARAELVADRRKAQLLFQAARSAQRAGDDVQAQVWARASIAVEPNVEAWMLTVALCRRQGELRAAAEALVEAAALSAEDARGPLRVEAADAFEEAGLLDRALEQVVLVAEQSAGLLAPAELLARWRRLGAHDRALAMGFGPALAEGRLDEALSLAEAAEDGGKLREALWALARSGSVRHAVRLAELLEAREDEPAQIELAEVLAVHAPELATALYRKLLRGAASVEVRRQATAALEVRGELEGELFALLQGLASDAAPALVELVLAKVRALPAERRREALSLAAEKLPARRTALLRERFELERETSPEAAVATLEALLPLEEDLRARAALAIERGELELHALGNEARAIEAFELALSFHRESGVAVRHLVDLYPRAGKPERFLAMCERLEQLAGPAAVASFDEARIDALAATGRAEDAAALLATLPETPGRLVRRVALAEQRGMRGEALALREKLAETDEARAILVAEALEAELLPFAVRLAEPLVETSALSAELRRALAARLARTPEGAKLSARLWPALLAEKLDDADGWTSYGEALVASGRVAAGALADGVGAALVGSTTATGVPTISALAHRPALSLQREPPAGVIAVTPLSMPRLHAALSASLAALGAERTRVLLHASGGPEAYLLSPDELVIGAGALGCFGSAELAYLSALALMLGDAGFGLTTFDEVDGWVDAAVAAFEAVPSSLAACRVLAQLEPGARGRSPAALDARAALANSRAFRAIARKLLGLV